MVFLITGCIKKETSEKNKKSKTSVFEVEQVSDKSITVVLNNAKAGEEKEAKLIIAKGENIIVKTKMEGATGNIEINIK